MWGRANTRGVCFILVYSKDEVLAEIRPWIASFALQERLAKMVREGWNPQQEDLYVTCEDEQFQRLTFTRNGRAPLYLNTYFKPDIIQARVNIEIQTASKFLGVNMSLGDMERIYRKDNLLEWQQNPEISVVKKSLSEMEPSNYRVEVYDEIPMDMDIAYNKIRGRWGFENGVPEGEAKKKNVKQNPVINLKIKRKFNFGDDDDG